MQTPQREPAEIPDPGNLAMPRKTNRRAAKYVATIGPFWDRRRADRKLRGDALRREDTFEGRPGLFLICDRSPARHVGERAGISVASPYRYVEALQSVVCRA